MDDLIVEVRRSKLQRLADIVILKFRVLALELRAIRIQGGRLDDATNGQAHAANARLAVHLLGIDGDSIEWDAHASSSLYWSVPEVLEPLGGRARVDGRVLRVAVSEVVLDRAQVVSLVRQRVAAGVT
jgi:hypothetical protein